MTYLQLVNRVMRNLRENTVSSVSDTVYSTLIGDFVNDAQRTVEQAWDWNSLRTTITVDAVADDNSYSLTGAGDDFKVQHVINDTANAFMRYQAKRDFNRTTFASTTGSPTYYSWNGQDSSGDPIVRFFPTPDGAYSIDFECIVRSPDMTNDGDTTSVPDSPIIYLASSMAARERGEQGGTSSNEYFGLFRQYLSDAIAIDSAKNPEDLQFTYN